MDVVGGNGKRNVVYEDVVWGLYNRNRCIE